MTPKLEDLMALADKFVDASHNFNPHAVAAAERALRAALEPLVMDAERYRWLRDISPSAHTDTPTVFDDGYCNSESNLLDGEELDAAIDAARGQQG